MRARDEDRTHACSTLDAGLAEGQLTAAEHAARIDQAMKASTLGDLHGLIEDLQGTSSLAPMKVPTIGPLSPRRSMAPGSNKGPIRVIGGVVVASVVAVIVVIATQPNSASIEAAGKPDMFAAGSFDKFTGDLRAEFGDVTVDSLVVYPHYAVVERAVPGAPRKSEHAYYDGTFDDPSQVPGRGVNTPTIDLSTVDTSVLAGLLAGASQSANVADATEMYYAMDPGNDGPTISVHVKNEAAESGSFIADLHGNFVAVHAFDPAK